MKKTYLLLLFSFCYCQLSAQDPYFSQFYNAPLYLNPALTGISVGTVRMGLNYRNQLTSVGSFETYSFSADMSIMENHKADDFAGVGLLVLNDDSGIGLSNLKTMLSLAYHKSLGSTNSYLAFGLQGGLDRTTLNLTRLSTQSQWVDGVGFDERLPSGEVVFGDNASLLDLQAGLLYYTFLENGGTLFAGAAAYHILEPEKSFLGSTVPLARRYVAHAGLRWPIGQRISLNPNVMFTNRGASTLFSPGLSMDYALSGALSTSSLTLGAWSRNANAFIINGGLEHKGFTIEASYDILLSKLTSITRQGGLELSLIYALQKKGSVSLPLLSNPNPRL